MTICTQEITSAWPISARQGSSGPYWTTADLGLYSLIQGHRLKQHDVQPPQPNIAFPFWLWLFAVYLYNKLKYLQVKSDLTYLLPFHLPPQIIKAFTFIHWPLLDFSSWNFPVFSPSLHSCHCNSVKTPIVSQPEQSELGSFLNGTPAFL